MGILTKILILILIFSFFVFVTFFGRIPALKNTPIATLHRILWVHIPKYFHDLDRRLTGGRLTSSVSRFSNHILYDRHPTVVIIFLVIMLAGYTMYLPSIWLYVSLPIKFITLLIASCPLIFLYLACAADPGYITPANHAYHMSLYPYDHALFRPGSVCRTCKIQKPPRSKHCSICKRCIAKADHHCVFINSCVGYGNHHWFLLLLFSTAAMTSYGGLMGLSILGSALQQKYPKWTMMPSRYLGDSYTRWFAIWGQGLRGNVPLGSTTLLALLTSPLVWGLSLYTLYQVYTGVTTNESLKWTELKEDMEDGYAWQRALHPNRQRDTRTEPRCDRWPVEPERVIVATVDGLEPKRKDLPGDGDWTRVRALRDVENLYDMGFLDNLGDAFVKDYAFGHGPDEPLAERRRKKR